MDSPAAIEHGLATALLELTDTLGDQFDPGSLLHELATAATAFLDVHAAGVLLAAEKGQLVPVATTHLRINRLAHLQAESDTGLVPESMRTKTCVSYPDLQLADEQWSPFARQTAGTGFRAAHAIPMTLHNDVIGCLLLFGIRAGALSDPDREAAWLLATAAATGLVHQRAMHHLETANGQLRHALTSRVAIEQAKGFLSSRFDLTPDQAFLLLRAHARRRRQRLLVIAEAIVDRRLDLAPPLAAPSGRERPARQRPDCRG